MKSCEDCNMCCKLPEILFISIDIFKWCNNCEISQGCKIYNQRPKKCKDFYCMYYAGETDLKPNKCGFFIFPERQESLEHKILTIYCEKHRLKDLPKKLLSDLKMSILINNQWAFHIRYNNDDNDLAIFDPNAFGDNLKYVKRKNYT